MQKNLENPIFFLTFVFRNNNPKEKDMKTFILSGRTANWAQFNLVALSKNGNTEEVTEIPENLQLKVTLADKFDVLCPNIDEVSEATSKYAFRHGKRRHFILMHAGRVVGWAAFHRVLRKFTVNVDYVSTEVVTVMAKSEQEANRKAFKQVAEELGEDCIIGAYNATPTKE